MNYSSNIDVYNFIYLMYLYIHYTHYTQKNVYNEHSCANINNTEMARLGLAEYGRNFFLFYYYRGVQFKNSS